MTDSRNGYQMGECVEVRSPDFDDEGAGWHVGTISRLDHLDNNLPYGVRSSASNDGSGWDWILADNIRKLTPQAPAKRWEWRYNYSHGGHSDWLAVSAGVIGCFGNLDTVEHREIPARSTEDILDRLRQLDSAGRLIPADVSRTLKGEF